MQIEVFICHFPDQNPVILFNLDWPIERNLQQCLKNSAEKNTDERKGSIHEPLISISFTQVIVDTSSFSQDHGTSLPPSKTPIKLMA